MFGEQEVELCKVARFLVVHVFHQRAKVRVRFGYWRRLGGVNEGCGQLAGLIHAEGGVEEFLLRGRERASAGGVRF